jgi:hypothetical protein
MSMTVDEQVDASPKAVQEAYMDLLLEEFMHMQYVERFTEYLKEPGATFASVEAAMTRGAILEAEEEQKRKAEPVLVSPAVMTAQDEHWRQMVLDIDALVRRDDPVAWAQEQVEKAARLAQARAIVAEAEQAEGS